MKKDTGPRARLGGRRDHTKALYYFSAFGGMSCTARRFEKTATGGHNRLEKKTRHCRQVVLGLFTDIARASTA